MKKIFLALLLLSLFDAYSQDSSIKITNANYKHSQAVWSPVEDLILFQSNMEGKKSIYTINSSGENIKRLSSLKYDEG